MQSHLHEFYEFVYITKGELIYTIEGREHCVSMGDLIFTRPNELHAYSFPKKTAFERRVLSVY
ncbi:MAG: AraC family ligand binding domain-containing protein, partial [Clostridia bacterium]|nr:AraC family ligand binding domain-containing protein [Clostridia bacterium]